MSDSLLDLLHLVETYKYLVLFPIAIFEGPIVTLVSGFLIAHGYLSGLLTYIFIIIADTIGDSLHYVLGYFLRDIRARKILKLFRITEEKIQRIEEHFVKHPKKSILSGKLLHGVGGVIQVAAGVAHMPFYEFIGLNILGTIPKTFILLCLGFLFGSYLSVIESYLTLWSVVAIIIVLCGVLWLCYSPHSESREY